MDPTDVIRRFENRHKALDQALGGSPAWHDGSAAAALLAIWWCVEPLVFNGGWPAVYYSRAGWAVELAARGYRLLGMNHAAERCDLAATMVAKVEAAHPGHDFQSDTWLHSTLMEAIDEADWDQLDDGWFELVGTTREAMAKYIEKNMASDLS